MNPMDMMDGEVALGIFGNLRHPEPLHAEFSKIRKRFASQLLDFGFGFLGSVDLTKILEGRLAGTPQEPEKND